MEWKVDFYGNFMAEGEYGNIGGRISGQGMGNVREIEGCGGWGKRLGKSLTYVNASLE